MRFSVEISEDDHIALLHDFARSEDIEEFMATRLREKAIACRERLLKDGINAIVNSPEAKVTALMLPADSMGSLIASIVTHPAYVQSRLNRFPVLRPPPFAEARGPAPVAELDGNGPDASVLPPPPIV